MPRLRKVCGGSDGEKESTQRLRLDVHTRYADASLDMGRERQREEVEKASVG